LHPGNPGKQCCILDTISLVKLCQLELGSKKAIEWLIEDFQVSIPKKVFEDGRRHISEADDEEAQAVFFRNVQQYVHYGKYNSCEKLIAECGITALWQYASGEDKPHVDEGERVAAALALRLGYEYRQYVIFVTDDLKAIPLLKMILGGISYQVGSVKNSYDLLLFLASRHPDEFPPNGMEIPLRQLNYLLRNNSPDAEPHQKPDELLGKYLDTLKKLSHQRLLFLDCLTQV